MYQELLLFTLRDKPLVSLNQQVQGSSPWRLTLDTESPSNGMGHITQRQLVDKKPWDKPFLDRRYYSSTSIIAIQVLILS